MSDIYVGGKASRLTYDAKQPRYTGVIINTSDDAYVSAGDIQSTNAHVLEVSCDWATEADAQRILDSISSVEYRPYDASGAIMNPAAELGDGITIGDIYSGIYTQNITFSRLMASDVSAPAEKAIDNEYKYESRQNRSYTRMVKNMKATFKIHADQIAAKVESVSTGESFGWSLLYDKWKLWSGNESNEILTADSQGLYVKGNGEFTGTIKASQFLNSAGQQMATADQVSAVMGSYAGGAIGGGAFFNASTLNDTETYPQFFTCGTLFSKSGISSLGAINSSTNITGDTVYAHNLYVRTGGGVATDIKATWQSKSFSVDVPSDFHVYDAQAVYNQDGIRILSYMNSYIGHGSYSQSIGSIYYLGQ